MFRRNERECVLCTDVRSDFFANGGTSLLERIHRGLHFHCLARDIVRIEDVVPGASASAASIPSCDTSSQRIAQTLFSLIESAKMRISRCPSERLSRTVSTLKPARMK